MLIILFLLNYFWLSLDPKESASWYCDQHCFKIGSEIIESVWDAALVLNPNIADDADAAGITKNYRRKRHSGGTGADEKGGLWHPLSVWHGVCRANMKQSLINAHAIFMEHHSRTGKYHSALDDCMFLLTKIEDIDFESKTWKKWFKTQNGTPNGVTKPKALEDRRAWCEKYGVAKPPKNRNTCKMTPPPHCINPKEFPGCDTKDLVEAYRNYYIAKIDTISGGMRYYYTTPPSWLPLEKVKTSRPAKSKKKSAVSYVRPRYVELDFGEIEI